MNNKPFSIKDRLKSFKHPFNGLKILIKYEHNTRIHLFYAVCVVIAGFVLEISKTEWAIIALTIGFVVVSEIFNSAIESLADYVSPQYNDLIKKTKDFSAAAVLVAAIIAVIIGLIIFLPKLIYYISNV